MFQIWLRTFANLCLPYLQPPEVKRPTVSGCGVAAGPLQQIASGSTKKQSGGGRSAHRWQVHLESAVAGLARDPHVETDDLGQVDGSSFHSGARSRNRGCCVRTGVDSLGVAKLCRQCVHLGVRWAPSQHGCCNTGASDCRVYGVVYTHR